MTRRSLQCRGYAIEHNSEVIGKSQVPAQHLKLDAFVHAADPERLRILHRDGGWLARSGEVTLERTDGSMFFADVTQLLGVLAGVGIRCCTIEWDGLQPQLDAGSSGPDVTTDHFNA